MRKATGLFFLFTFLIVSSVSAREYHVSLEGSDSNKGTLSHPFRTISRAAQKAVAGDVIIVHRGVYREWVNPPRGGESNEKRIVYKVAEGEKAVIKGSEVIKGWKRFKGNVWRVVLSNEFFGDFNPYKEIIYGDWFNDKGRVHHRGEVFIDGRTLYESPILDDLFKGYYNRWLIFSY